MQPTSFGAVAAPVAPAESTRDDALVLPANFPLTLQPGQIASLRQRIAAFDIASTPQEQIALLGAEPTLALNRVLDSLLARINRAENPQIFKLIPALDEAVAKERLGELADNILNAKPGLMDRLVGLFNKKALRRALDRVYEDLERAARLKSRTLSDVVTDMERKLGAEMATLNEELRELDALKTEYRTRFVSFAEETAFLNSALAKAQREAPAQRAAAGADIARCNEIDDKLQALASVALARETMMTRLPSEQIVIRQVQNAGVSTLQEVITTMGDRFASIRMTLLTIHGSQMVQNVQRLAQSGAHLDRNLQEVRARLMAGVVETAAHAPGNNRLEQAQSLQRVVADTQALQAIVDNARTANRAKFEEARTTLAGVRQDLLELGQKLNPAATVAPHI
ncbi:hypothetical protein [Paraburkholderia acidisoli]|uniref:Toxic anion resistance protein TelA n=1 Tax=Paraburkholderia acidisoli TaxID=2571748 RepID=A0A7Z2GP77_9BURK|nr:hypothetical protein [Paraburkholderia acidisoli]QGZ65442.1 hypothetical protein FAZ98_27180 [Paraburkholderia acidisoli]